MKNFPTDRVGNLVSDVLTWNPASSGDTDSFFYIDISSVNRESKSIAQTQEVSPSGAPSRARQLVEEGDVLVSTVRPNLNAVAIVENEFAGATASTGFCVLRPRKDRLCSRYLYHWVRSPAFVEDMTAKATGASYPAISDKIIKESYIPGPPLPEQRRIAAILDKADAILRKREEGIRLTEELLRSTFLEMFGDPATNPKGWDVELLSKLCEKFSDGPFGSNLKSEHYRESGVRVIRLQNIGSGEWFDENKAFISEDHFESLPRHHCGPGDVIIATLGDPNLRACILPEHVGVSLNKADCIQARVKSRTILPEFLCAYLNTKGTLGLVSKMLHGQTRVRVSMGQLKNLPIYLPPISDQMKFAETVQKIHELKDRRKVAVNEAAELIGSLVQRSFQGNL